MGAQPVRQRLVRVLLEDPDLADRLDKVEARLAERQTVGFLEQVPTGPWQPSSLSDGKSLYGGVILDGLLVRELALGAGTTAELLGGGEVLLPRDADQAVPFVAPAISWTALQPTRIAWLDVPFGLALRRWPELAATLLERSQRRADRLALGQAVSQLTRVEDRVLTLMWHLAERWGRVRTDGIVLPMKLTHRVIARLVGARRPSVTTAVNALERKNLVERLDDGGWLLHGRPPAELGDPGPPPPWRHGRGNTVAISFVDGPTVQPPPAEPDTQRQLLLRDRIENAVRISAALHATSRELLAQRPRRSAGDGDHSFAFGREPGQPDSSLRNRAV
jgi:CRP/FNR family cyclic AMP-dependent transcriptional regulator